MKVPRLKKWQWAVLCLFVIYCLGYGLARRSLMLVHRVGFETDAGKVKYLHDVDMGASSRLSLFANPNAVDIWEKAQKLAYWVYSPLRWCEVTVWRFLPRKYEWRNGPSG